MHGSQYVNNQLSHDEDHEVAWSQNPMVYKTKQLLQELGKTRFPITSFFTLVGFSLTQLIHQPEKNVGCKVLQFITRWRSKSSLVTKPHGVQTQQFLQEKDELGHMSLVHNMLVKNFCIELHQLWRPLKQSLYMFRVVKKESLNIHSWIGLKSVWKTELHKPR